MRLTPYTAVLALILLACSEAASQSLLTKFEDYPVSQAFTGKPAPAVIVGSQASYYRTRIRLGAQHGPNFAGHYTVVTWGCGSGCQGFAVVDARSGKVYFNPLAASVGTVPYQDEDPLQFRIDSRLLVVSGYIFGLKRQYAEAKFYFHWHKNRFSLLKKTAIKKYGL